MARLYLNLSSLAREPVLWIAVAFTAAYLIGVWCDRETWCEEQRRALRGFEVAIKDGEVAS